MDFDPGVIALGLLVRQMHLNSAALRVWFATLQIGTWANGGAGLIAGFLGASSKLMPTINEKFPPPHDTKMRLFQTRSRSAV